MLRLTGTMSQTAKQKKLLKSRVFGNYEFRPSPAAGIRPKQLAGYWRDNCAVSSVRRLTESETFHLWEP